MSIETKDYWTIIALEACGHVPLDIQANEPKEGRSCVLTYFFPEEAEGDFDKWMRGENTEPFGIIRTVQQSATKFKNNLHRYHAR